MYRNTLLPGFRIQKAGKIGIRRLSFRVFSPELFKKAASAVRSVHGIFELTPLCNLSCRMCYVHLTGEQLGGKSVLLPEQWKSLMLQAWEAGMMQATLTGGECLSYPGFEDIYLYLHSLGCEIILLTNGALLDEKRIDFLLRHRPAGIQITLYGQNDDVYERVTGQRAFHTVEENIRRAADAGLDFVLNVTPSVYLGEDVFDTLRAAYQLRPVVYVNSSIYSPRQETGRSEQKDDIGLDMYTRIYQLRKELMGHPSEEIPEELLPEPGCPDRKCGGKGFWCSAGMSSFTVDWKGEMYPCSRLRMIQASPLRTGFPEAWSSIHKQSENWAAEPACHGCPYEDVCNPCPADVMRFSRPGGRPEELCNRTKHFVHYGVLQVPDCT